MTKKRPSGTLDYIGPMGVAIGGVFVDLFDDPWYRYIDCNRCFYGGLELPLGATVTYTPRAAL